MTLKYKNYTIVEKRDFGSGPGYWITGFHVKHGYVVTDGGIINVMPGATWFLTVEDAKAAIDILLVSGESQKFWDLWELRKRHIQQFNPVMFVDNIPCMHRTRTTDSSGTRCNDCKASIEGAL